VATSGTLVTEQYCWLSCTTWELPIALYHREEYFSDRLPKELGVHVWRISNVDLHIDAFSNAAVEC
jgi:hypothetical protein